MTDGTVLLVVLLACFCAIAVLLAAAEAALLRVRRVRIAALAADGVRRARRVLRLLDDLPAVLNTILLVVLLVQIGAATVTGILADRWLGNWGVTIASVLLTFVLFIYSEAIPKTFACRHPARVAMAVGRPVALLVRTLRPIIRALVWIADRHLPPGGNGPTVTERELRLLAAEAAGAGEITAADRELIELGFRLGDLTVAEVMVPRPDIVAVDAHVPVHRARRIAVRSGHRRLLVYDGDLDHLRGAVDLRALASAPEDAGAGSLAGPVPAVPEHAPVVGALREMQDAAASLAVVVDEHGGTAGLLTAEDIADELLGAVGDAPVESIRDLGDGRRLVGGRVRVDDLEEHLGVSLPEGEWTTVAGLVMGIAGRVPDVGDTVVVAGFRMRVAAMVGRRIARIEVTPESPGSGGTAGATVTPR